MSEIENDTQEIEYDIKKVNGYISPEKLEQMLEEVISFEVYLETDPTSVEGSTSKYLHERLSSCRSYVNRTLHYLQICKKYEKNLKRMYKLADLDVQFKTSELLSDDPIVKAAPSIKDRMALVHMKTQKEVESRDIIEVESQNLDDVIKLIKSKYDDLKQTNSDIKLQRQIIKDEIDDLLKDRDGEGGGFTKPTTDKHGNVEKGMIPAVKAENVNPSDLLDSKSEPEPEPIPKKEKTDSEYVRGFFTKPITEKKSEKSEKKPENVEARQLYKTLLDD